MKAFIFPGQGAQFVGMCKDLAENHKAAKEVFEEVDEALNFNLSEVIFNGPEQDLTLTSNTQPALMACSIAILRVLEQESSTKFEQLCDVSAGHSLGQYTALCAAGSLSLSDTAKILRVRGQAMQESCPEGQGAMAACLNVAIDDLEKILQASRKYGCLEVANDNSLDQIVISGAVEAIDNAVEQLKSIGKKAIKLKVSAPFHSPLMDKAADTMSNYFKSSRFVIKNPIRPVIDNTTLKYLTDNSEIENLLVQQITGRVRWRETVELLEQKGFSEVLEIGPSNVLTKINQRANYKFQALALSNYEEIKAYIDKIS